MSNIYIYIYSMYIYIHVSLSIYVRYHPSGPRSNQLIFQFSLNIRPQNLPRLPSCGPRHRSVQSKMFCKVLSDPPFFLDSRNSISFFG